MIVAVSASPVHDKSGVVESLALEHGLAVVGDPAPGLCARYGFQTLYEMPFEFQTACREELLHEHLAFLGDNDGVIFEFSVVEWLADWMRWCWSKTPTETWARVLAVGRESAASYSQIHHIEAGPQRTYDGYVWLDRENASQVDSLIRFLHSELGVSDAVRTSRG